MKNVIILFDLIAREYWACNEIKHELEKKQINVYLFQWNFEYYKALRVARNKPIEAIIIPSCYTAADYRRVVMPFKKLNYGIKVLCMHHEQIGYIGEEGGLVPTEDLAKNTMFHLSWGEHFTNLLVGSGVCQDLIIEAGNPRLQENLLKRNTFSKEELAVMYNLDPQKKWILYCDSGGSLFYEMNLTGKLASQLIGGTEMADEMVPLYSETYLKTLDIFNNLNKEFFDCYELIFRLHPGVKDVDRSMFSEKIHIIRDFTVYTWLRYAEYNLTAYSTTIFESDALGIKSLLLNPVDLKHEVVGVCEYTKIRTKEELEKTLLNNESFEINKDIYIKYIGKMSDDCIKNLVGKIEEIIGNQNRTINIECSVNNKKKYSSMIANAAFYTFYKMGLLQYIKWPFAFEMNKYEHPVFKNKYLDNSKESFLI